MPGEKVSIPGLGEVDKKYAAAGVVVAAGFAIVYVIRQHNAKNAAATAAATPGTQTDPAGNVGTIDPATGYVFGSPEDTQAQSYAQNQGVFGVGSSGIDPQTGYEYGTPADTAALASLSGGGGGGGSTSSGSGVTSNSQWVTEAGGIVPGDSATITTALASVLGGLTVTTAQRDLFMEAVGILGPPPQGYPTPIKTSDTAGHPSTGGSGNTNSGGGGGAPHITGPGPSVIGKTLAQATAIINGAGYHVNNVSGNQAGHVVSSTAYSDMSVNLGMS